MTRLGCAWAGQYKCYWKGDLVLSGSAWGWLVAYGFLTSCRKEFTTQAQVIMRVRLLKPEKCNKEGLNIEAAAGGPKQGCLDSLEML